MNQQMRNVIWDFIHLLRMIDHTLTYSDNSGAINWRPDKRVIAECDNNETRCTVMNVL